MFSFLSLACVILITNNLSSVLLFNWLARRRSSQGALDVTVIIIITNTTSIIIAIINITINWGALWCYLLWTVTVTVAKHYHIMKILWSDMHCLESLSQGVLWYNVICPHHFLRIYLVLWFSCISSILFKFTPQQEAVWWVFRVLLFWFQLVHWRINRDKTTFKMKQMSMSRNSPKAEIQKVLIFSATSNETLWQTI